MDETHGIAFGTDGWRTTVEEMTADRVRLVGRAVGTYLTDERISGDVAIGYDARASSPGLAETLAAGVAETGRNVVLAAGDCPTPALAWSVSTGGFAGGLAVTASHNPPEYNGIKFVPADGTPALPAVTDAIEQRLDTAAGGESEVTDGGHVHETDFVPDYIDHALDVPDALGASTDLDGLSVVYDAMHGSGRGVTDTVLERAGASVERLRCDRDAEFGGTAPEPVPENVERLRERVTDGPAALGIVNDGDADRLGLVTPERGFLDPNVVLAVLYDFLLTRRDGAAVRTVSTSSLVDRVAEAHGQAVHETPVGFKWVAQAMGDHDALVGGEESGGYGVSAHLRNKDGVVLALLAAVAHSERSLDDRIAELFATHGEIHQDRRSLDCPDAAKGPVLDALEAALPDTFAGEAVADVSTVDGFKLTLADGTWVLVRPSGTEPKLRLYAEATARDRVTELLDAGRSLVEPVVERQR